MDKLEIINRIGILRTRANLSARALSTRIGKNEGYINRLEVKKDFLPTLETLLDIIEECGSSTEEFFYYDLVAFSSDKEVIQMLKGVQENKKRAVIELLSNH